MNYPWQIVVSTLVFLALYTVTSLTVLQRLLTTFARRVLWVMLSFIWILLGLNIAYAYPTQRPANYIQQWFHLDFERNIPNTFSFTLLFFVSVLSLFIAAKHHSSRPLRAFWLFVGLTFGVIAYDELLAPKALHGTNALLALYGLCGAVTLVYMLRLWLQSEGARRHYFTWFILGFGLIGFGGLVLDKTLFIPVSRTLITMLEETVELVGLLTLLVLTLTAAADHFPHKVLRGTQAAFMAIYATLILAFAVRTWVYNPVHMWLDDATADQTVFGEDVLSLVAYDLPDTPLQPGDVVRGTFYLRANRIPPADYQLSTHLISTSGESIAQVEDNYLGTARQPVSLWIPGVIARHPIEIQIPADIPAPAAYSLTLRFWSGNVRHPRNWEDWQSVTVGLPVQQTEHGLLSEDTLRLTDFVVLPPEVNFTGQPSDLAFDNGIDLEGHQVPEQIRPGEEISVAFHWQADAAISSSLVQILHLVGEDEQRFVFDRPPFGGTLPTETWPPDFSAVDRFSISLPDDLAVGEYQLYTGLYAVADPTQRVGVLGSDGEVYTDELVPLDVLQVLGAQDS